MTFVLWLLSVASALPLQDRSPEALSYQAGTKRLQLNERLVYDSQDSLSSVGAIITSHDGLVYVTDPMERRILVFDAFGKLIRTMGRPGKGPGEFQRLGPIGLVGDTVWVGDPISRRVTLFGPSGELLRSKLFGRPANSGYELAYPVPSEYLKDGSALAMPSMTAEYFGRPGFERVPVLRMLHDGRSDTAFFLSLTHYTWEVSNGHELGHGTQPFSDATLAAFSSHGAGAVVVERQARTDEGQPVFTVVRIGGKAEQLYRVAIRYDPLPIPREAVDSAISALAEGAKGQFRSRREALAAFKAGIHVPSSCPPVSRVLFTGDDSVWLAREACGHSEVRWDRLSSTGMAQASIVLRNGVRIWEATGEYLWTVEVSDQGLPQVVRYKWKL